MNLKFNSLPFCAFLALYTLSFSFLSSNIPFLGDELGTLNYATIYKPIPYILFLKSYFYFYSPSVENILFTRTSSLCFTFLAFLIWDLYLLKGNREKLTFYLVVLANSFLLIESTYFRYYSYFFFTSTIFLLFLVCFKKKSSLKKLTFSLALVLFSPSIFFIMNVLQYSCYFALTLFLKYIKSVRYRVSILIIFFLSLGLIIKNPKYLWIILEFINLSDHGNISLESENIRGLTKAILIKPFFAFYQMFFGYFVTPTESLIFILFIIYLFSVLAFILFKISIKDGEYFLYCFFSFIFPFITLYYLFESISLPGITQLESKHGLFLFPLLLLLIVKSHKYLNSNFVNPFIASIIIFQFIGLSATYKKNHANWSNIVDIIQKTDKNNTSILIDGRSNPPFQFYNNNKTNLEQINYTWEDSELILDILDDSKDSLILLLNDYKSYVSLDLNQNWNAGVGSYNRFNKLSLIIEEINKRYLLCDSYIIYPTFLYIFKKKEQDITKQFGVWEHHLKDLTLPIEKDGIKTLSSILLSPGDSIYVKCKGKIICNLEDLSNHSIREDTVGTIISNKKTYDLINLKNIWNVFADYNRTPYASSNVYYSWIHKPLVSGSISYSGSYFKHKANLYFLDLKNEEGEIILVKNISNESNIRIWN